MKVQFSVFSFQFSVFSFPFHVSLFAAVKQFLETVRNGRLETEVLACYRMGEAEHICVQAKTTHRVLVTAILAVADNRVTKVGHMYTNLVLSTGLEFAFHKRIAV